MAVPVKRIVALMEEATKDGKMCWEVTDGQKPHPVVGYKFKGDYSAELHFVGNHKANMTLHHEEKSVAVVDGCIDLYELALAQASGLLKKMAEELEDLK